MARPLTTVLSGALRLGYGTTDDGPAEVLPVGTVAPFLYFDTKPTFARPDASGSAG